MTMEWEKAGKLEDDWKTKLTSEQYRVCREKGTEQPYSGSFNACTREGTYCCVCCGNPLFNSTEKYNSGSGWPSFWQPYSEESVHYESDTSFGMMRIEVCCSNCDAHLGHLFDDGPDPTGKRYCINSISLTLDQTAEEI